MFLLRSNFKTQFPLRTAAISSRCVVGTKIVLDVALATPATILNIRLARENSARYRDESSFETASKFRMGEIMARSKADLLRDFFLISAINNLICEKFPLTFIFKKIQ